MKNIPRQLRTALKPGPGRMDANRTADAMVPELYPEEGGSVRFRKGEWTIRFQRNHAPFRFVPASEPDTIDGFCAVYRREGAPKAFVCGDTADKGIVETALEAASRKMTDQRRLFAFPARDLNSDNGFQYGIKWGLRLMVFLTILIVFDAFLIPKYPEAIAEGLAISFLGGESGGLDFTGYESLTLRIVLALFGEENLALAMSVYTLIAFFVLPILLIALFTEIFGKKADEIRMKALPEEARGFLYGEEARNALAAAHRQKQDEQRKTRLYEYLSERGLKDSREEFQTFYDEMLK